MRSLSLITLAAILVIVLAFRLQDDPPHGKDFNLACELCHSEKGWFLDMEIYSFDHNSTIFPLLGQHTDVNCKSCHESLIFSEAETECAACHMDIHQETVGDDCARCHNSNSWIVNNITEIHQLSRFPLVGAHLNAECFECHESASSLLFEPLNIECVDCHIEDYSSATNPNHSIMGFSTDCYDCHSVNPGWKPAIFYEHEAFFPIYSGEHSGAWSSCSSCHPTPNNYQVFTCISCHEHNREEMDDEHSGIGGYIYESQACLNCHPTGSEGEGFNHNLSNFPLTGAHITTDCLECHTSGFQGTPTICYACHDADFNQSTNPDHNALQLSTECDECHTTLPGWSPASFDVHNNYYELLGEHLNASCNECHINGYTNTPTLCFDCHNNDYNQSTNPDHNSLGLSTSCEECHSITPDWTPASFDIHNNYYELLGAHSTVSCNECHTNGYTGTSTLCFDCHSNDYNQTSNPSHTSLNFATTCEDCHDFNPGWTPATFDHNSFYPLNGAHATISNDCNACHNGNYVNTPNTCIGCHQDEYNNATNPPHASAQFSTDCELCHSEFAWQPSTFDHDNQYFPIYSGSHNNEWNTCTECHTNPTNYAVFSCIDCHEHNQPDMDDEHQEVSGYSYNSLACLTCHPNGNSDHMINVKKPRFNGRK